MTLIGPISDIRRLAKRTLKHDYRPAESAAAGALDLRLSCATSTPSAGDCSFGLNHRLGGCTLITSARSSVTSDTLLRLRLTATRLGESHTPIQGRSPRQGR